jgi:UDP-N-acetylmuramate--alanine ligase
VTHLVPGQHIHLVGIGGFGMSAIARVLLQQGYYISGSDRAANALTQALAQEGADIRIGHDAQHVMGAELVIASSAVPPDHVELSMAHALGIPVYKRADIIAAIMSGQTGIAVAGTHGKTTTAAMIAHILLETGQDPSYIIGGILRNTGRNASMGRGRAFVIEADEYDNMFHGLRPQVAIVTSVEYDHPDFFTSPAEMMKSFAQFVALLPDDGLLIACADDPAAMILAQNRQAAGLQATTYGIERMDADWWAANVRYEDGRTLFDVLRGDEKLGSAQLIPPGVHNVLNALAALIAANSQGVPFADAARALNTCQGTGRRFELRGEVGGVAVIDDYAHHPTAIRKTLEAARQRFPDRAVWAVWQPHTYSRTHALLDQYLGSFDAAHHVLVTDIYAAREEPVPGVSSGELVRNILHPDARHTRSLSETARVLDNDVEEPAVVVIMSAGDAPLVGVDFLRRRRERLSRADEDAASPAG